MNRVLITLILFVTLICAKAQTISSVVAVTNVDSAKTIFTSVEMAPEFPGGLQEFYKFLSTNIRYPKIARQNNTQGRVIIQFIVERNGGLSDLRVVRGVSKEIDEEALRVLNLCPKWRPGIQNGKAVRCAYTVPISFSLTK